MSPSNTPAQPFVSLHMRSTVSTRTTLLRTERGLTVFVSQSYWPKQSSSLAWKGSLKRKIPTPLSANWQPSPVASSGFFLLSRTNPCRFNRCHWWKRLSEDPRQSVPSSFQLVSRASCMKLGAQLHSRFSNFGLPVVHQHYPGTSSTTVPTSLPVSPANVPPPGPTWNFPSGSGMPQHVPLEDPPSPLDGQS